MIQVKCIVSSTKNFLCFFKHFIFNHTKLRTFHNKPFRFILLSSLTSQKITDFLLSIDNLSRINLIGQNPTDGILAPFAISLCSIPFFIQHIRNFGSTVTFFCVPLVNLFDNLRFFFVNLKVKIIPDRFIITVHNIRNSSLFCIQFLSKFHSLRCISAFFLSQCSKDGENKLTISHTCHIRCKELGFNT